jgi:hypothetical protein
MHWSVVVGGIYSPNHQKNYWWGLLLYGAPDSPVRHRTLSGVPAMSPGRWVPIVGALTSGATGQSGGAPDSHCSLSGAPSDACSDFCARSEHCSLFLYRCRWPLALGAVAPLGAPDSPVLHRTVRWIIAKQPPQIPEASELERIHPGAPDTVRCARPGQPSVALLLSFWTLSSNFVLVYCEPLAPVKLIF